MCANGKKYVSLIIIIFGKKKNIKLHFFLYKWNAVNSTTSEKKSVQN